MRMYKNCTLYRFFSFCFGLVNNKTNTNAHCTFLKGKLSRSSPRSNTPYTDPRFRTTMTTNWENMAEYSSKIDELKKRSLTLSFLNSIRSTIAKLTVNCTTINLMPLISIQAHFHSDKLQTNLEHFHPHLLNICILLSPVRFFPLPLTGHKTLAFTKRNRIQRLTKKRFQLRYLIANIWMKICAIREKSRCIHRKIWTLFTN